MKILLVNTNYYPRFIGGAEKSVQALAEGLVSNGFQVTTLCLGAENKKYIHNGVSVIQWKYKNIYDPFEKSFAPSLAQKLIWHFKDSYIFQFQKEMLSLFKTLQPDIVHTHNLAGFGSEVWKMANQSKIKTIHSLRDYYLQCYKTTKYRNDANCNSLCADCSGLSIKKKKNSQFVHYLIGISDFILKDHLKNGYFPSIPNQIIYNGVPYKKAIRKPINSTPIKFGYIGRLNKAKGVAYMLDEFQNIDTRKFQLKIAGEEVSEFEKYKKNPSIEFMGVVPSEEFFNQIDILIVPSLWNEPFGRVVIEGVSAGKLVLGSNRGAIPEIINNENLIFEPLKGELSQKINELIENKEIIHTINIQNDIDKFNMEKVIEDHIFVYNKIYGKSDIQD